MVAAPRPPSTRAPSEAITISPACAGSATQSAVRISGAARVSVFCHAKPLAKPPRQMSAYTSSGLCPRTAMKPPKRTSAAASAATGMANASAAGPSATRARGAGANTAASDGTNHPFDQIVHLLEDRLGLLVGGAGRDDLLAGIGLQRTLEDRVAPLLHLGEDTVGFLARRLGHRLPIRRHLHEALLQAAAHEIDHRLAFERGVDVSGVGREPAPFRAGEVALGRQRRLVGVVAADVDAAPLRGLDHHLRTVDVAGDHVHALVDEAVRRFGFLDG